ncbi:MAG TPA: MBL fold metallo-hydrolase [Vicinamibacterales bacterium]|nr:MBL fold metallo-hydrolase [Vicinamibacterales bacterium]
MKRTLVLGTLVAVGTLSATVAAFQQPAGRQGGGARGAVPFGQEKPSADALMVEKVKNNLFVLRGGGGNTAVFVTANGVVLVDTKLPGWGQPLIQKVRTLTDKPVTTIINTHAHFDHASGNVEFPANVEIVTHQNTKTYMEQGNPVSGVQQGPQPNIYTQNGGRGLPTRTYRDSLTIGKGDERIELRYFGPAHTGGDTFVIFPAHRIAHAGDVFPNKGLPIMDKNNGGSGLQYAETVERAAKGLTGVDAIINGHTDAQTTVADLREYAAFLREFVAGARAAKAAGKSSAQFAAEWKTPAKFSGYQPVTTEGPGPNLSQADFARNNAAVIFAELK